MMPSDKPSDITGRNAARASRPRSFVHGFAPSKTIWRFVAPALEIPARTFSYDHAVAARLWRLWDVAGTPACRRCAAGPDRTSPTGWPERDLRGPVLGSIIAMLAALQQPDRFEQIVALAASPRFLNHPRRLLGWLPERADLGRPVPAGCSPTTLAGRNFGAQGHRR